jgi:DNA-binding XRE family transcriptional regulator
MSVIPNIEPAPWYRIRTAASLGDALAASRQARGLTQAEAAHLIGAERTTLLNMEAGRNRALERMVKAFGQVGYDLIAVPRSAHVQVDAAPTP